ncbi:MAG: DUF975 family protein [Lactobacillus sp.]|jgi:uncharacterized membrane protein|nr:DUF975 family protein [Lactobacillus sp.]
MKISIGALKRQVKATFKDNWVTAVQVTFVPALLSTLASIIILLAIIILMSVIIYAGSQLLNDAPRTVRDAQQSLNGGTWQFTGQIGRNLVTNLIGVLMFSGIQFTFLDWLRQKDAVPEHPFKSAFQGFTGKYIGRLLVLGLLINIFTWLWTLLLIIPGIIMGYAYRMTYFIYKDRYDEDLSFLQTISASKALMKGHKWQLFLLDLSFLGWFILGFIGLGIPLFWVYPYYQGTIAAFYDALVQEPKEATAVAAA